MANEQTDKIQYDPEKLKKIIKEKGTTEAKLCENLGYSHSYFAYTKKAGCVLKKSDMMAICYLLGVTEKDLVPDKKPENKENAKSDDFFMLMKSVESLTSSLTRMERKIDSLDSKLVENDKKFQEISKFNATIQKDMETVESDAKATRNGINTVKQQNEKLKDQMDSFRTNMETAINDLSKQFADLKLDIVDALAENEEEPPVDVIQKRELDTAVYFLTEMLQLGKNEQNQIYNEAAKRGIGKGAIERAKKQLGISVFFQGYGKNQRKIWTKDNN